MKGWSYQRAGVDIAGHERWVERLRPIAASASRPEVLAGVGPFAGLFDARRLEAPILVASADGVGSKVLLAAEVGRWEGIGIDCVAMNVNDILTAGAEPLFFLDYLAVHRLEPHVLEALLAGLAAGCREAGCALLGGETAQLPDLYRPGELDVAGFCVGVVSADRVVDGSRVRPGDRIVGLASSGVHANGFSLVRRILKDAGGGPVEDLLRPTRIYVRPVLDLLRSGADVRGMAHITGGGLPGNLPRALPAGLGAWLHPGAWPEPGVFGWLRQAGGVPEEEMRRVFNLGLGFCLVLPPGEEEAACRMLQQRGVEAWVVGDVVPGEGVRFH